MQTPDETLDPVGALVRRLCSARGEALSQAIAAAWALLERHRAVLDYEWVVADPARLAVLPERHGRPTIEEFAAHRLDDVESDFREIHGDLVPRQLLERQLTAGEAAALHGALLALLERPPDVARQAAFACAAYPTQDLRAARPVLRLLARLGDDGAPAAGAAVIEAVRATVTLLAWALDRAPYGVPLDTAAWDTVEDAWNALAAVASHSVPQTGGTAWTPKQEAEDGLERIARRLTTESGSRAAPETLRARAAAWLARPRPADPSTTWDWEAWRASVSPRRRRRADEVLARLRALGLQDPEQSAIAEVRENEPRLARFTLLRRLWRELVDPYHDPDRFDAWINNMTAQPDRYADPRAGAAVRRLLALGADPQDLRHIVRSTVWDTVFHVLDILDGGEPLYDPPSYPDIDYDAYPRWTLMEADASGRSTGRRIERLHEDFGPTRSDIWRDSPSDSQ